ncbi:MAG: DUF6020 family protein [bacterium]|nr:DUF6020 family protein [bacterium]
MKVIQKKDKKHVAIIGIMAFLITCIIIIGMNLELTVNKVLLELSASYLIGIEGICIWAVLYRSLQSGITRRQIRYIAIGSLSFSLIQVLCKSYEELGNWNFIFASGSQFFKACIYIVGKSLIVATVLLLCGHLFSRIEHLSNHQAYVSTKSIWITGVLTFVGIIVCWLPYCIVFFPGSNFQDTMTQIMQYFHFPSMTAGIKLTDGVTTYFSGHHPIFLTLVYGSFVKLGVRLGNPAIGVAVFTIVQMIFLAGIFTISICYYQRIGVHKLVLNSMAVIYAICPYFSYNSVAMVKDVTYAAFILIMNLYLFEIVRSNGKSMEKRGFKLGLTVALLMMMLTKNQGMYISVILFLAFGFRYRSHFKSILMTFGVALILYIVVFNKVICSLLGVNSGGIQEALSVPFQQTARYVAEHENEVTEQEKEAIDRVLDYKRIKRLYNPVSSDPVKATYKAPAMSELMGYLKVWAIQLIKHPTIYAEAYIHNYYNYFNIERICGIGYGRYFNVSYRKKFLEGCGIPKEDYEYLEVRQNKTFASARKTIGKEMIKLQKLPVIKYMNAVGMMFWFAIGIGIMCCYSRKYKHLLAYLAIWLTIFVCLVSPVFDKRYVFPVIFSLPAMFAFYFVKISKN